MSGFDSGCAKQRGKRIHHRNRMIAKAKRIADILFPHPWSGETWDDLFVKRERFARKAYDNLSKCSCWRCGNPRKYFKHRPIQEQKAIYSDRGEFEDLRNACTWKRV